MTPHNRRNPRNNGFLTGIFFIAGGILLLAYKMGADIPSWIFSWPMILICIGLIMGIQSRFKNGGAYIMILIGSLFLIDKLIPEVNMGNYIAPIAIIGVGIMFLLKRRHHDKEVFAEKWQRNMETTSNAAYEINSTDAEFIESTNIFGGAKKVIMSKNFKGGEITCFMGGAEIDLSKADIQGRTVMNLTNIFGGTKLNVPSNWDVKSEISAVFGGVEDKRPIQYLNTDPAKILILNGTCIFGGIEINSY
ncbi:LiaF transmembrane domain-containing protein [Foetidibacter luteolus]|uniref:LiaF transmembrane domain-containing protein n=1 Tax=Foetidibacter luteolus TaxID=2608880 RepID=UPI001A99069B|nr:LiaF domain-containing protein [Foetidibacter luteolus]